MDEGRLCCSLVGSVGIIANPAAGKDIRRLVAHASTFDNLEKVSIVRRVLLGLAAADVDEVLYMPDAFGIVSRAVQHLHNAPAAHPLELQASFDASDSTRAAELLRDAEVSCIITLGGDGTNRAVAKGCGSVPLLAISTGTNNVFPQLMEGTIAGMAAGVVASGVLDAEQVAPRRLCLELLTGVGQVDLALVDVAVCRDRFTGARAIWDPAAVRQIISTSARSDVTGLSSIGGFLPGVHLGPEQGLTLEIGDEGEPVFAPLAPGLVTGVKVRSYRTLHVGECVDLDATAGTVALDGERELSLHTGLPMRVRLSADGPRVINVPLALRRGVDAGLFTDDCEIPGRGRNPLGLPDES